MYLNKINNLQIFQYVTDNSRCPIFKSRKSDAYETPVGTKLKIQTSAMDKNKILKNKNIRNSYIFFINKVHIMLKFLIFLKVNILGDLNVTCKSL